MIHKLHCMQISHVSEDDETFFYPLSPRGLVTKWLIQWNSVCGSRRNLEQNVMTARQSSTDKI